MLAMSLDRSTSVDVVVLPLEWNSSPSASMTSNLTGFIVEARFSMKLGSVSVRTRCSTVTVGVEIVCTPSRLQPTDDSRLASAICSKRIVGSVEDVVR